MHKQQLQFSSNMVNEQCEFNVGGLEKGKMEGKCLENGLENVQKGVRKGLEKGQII